MVASLEDGQEGRPGGDECIIIISWFGIEMIMLVRKVLVPSS